MSNPPTIIAANTEQALLLHTLSGIRLRAAAVSSPEAIVTVPDQAKQRGKPSDCTQTPDRWLDTAAAVEAEAAANQPRLAGTDWGDELTTEYVRVELGAANE
jgi:hypothetical protein